MEGLISLAVFALIIFRIIVKTQKMASAPSKSASRTSAVKTDFQPAIKVEAVKENYPSVKKSITTSPKVSGVNKNLHGGTQGSSQVVNTKSRSTLSALSASMENRGNDWLAKQLAEERVAKKRMSDMFNLKQEHAEFCDAERNKMNHYTNCGANGVDMARG